jgi:hypothetical protein
MLRALVVLAVVGAVTLVAAGYESRPLAADARADRIVVEKAARKLTLFRGETPLKSYSAARPRAQSSAKEIIALQKAAISLTHTSTTARFIVRCIFPIPVRPIQLPQRSVERSLAVTS